MTFFPLFEITKFWYIFYKIDPHSNLILMQLETWILKIVQFLAYLLKNLLRLKTNLCLLFFHKNKNKLNQLFIYLSMQRVERS